MLWRRGKVVADLSRRQRGRGLNQECGIGAKHALYRANGTWYHQLTAFPGALVDAHGYICTNLRVLPKRPKPRLPKSLYATTEHQTDWLCGFCKCWFQT
jgi:hypothetical protein